VLKKVMMAAALAAAVAGSTTFGQSKVQLEKIKLPPGFQISVWADGVANARSIAQMSPNSGKDALEIPSNIGSRSCDIR